MTNCPRCHQSINTQTVTCPHCNNQLKAFGHPGIPLYQASENAWLCSRCLYHEDNSCNFPQRPHAKSCTLFHDRSLPLVEAISNPQPLGIITRIKVWLRVNRGLVMLAVLVIISIVLALG